MSKFSRGASAWKEHRIADDLSMGGVDYTVGGRSILFFDGADAFAHPPIP